MYYIQQDTTKTNKQAYQHHKIKDRHTKLNWTYICIYPYIKEIDNKNGRKTISLIME